MPTRSALTLIDAIAEETARIGVTASSNTVRAQAAFVRTLVDEVGRRHPSERSVAPLHTQLGEELSRLAELVQDGHREAPASERVEVLVVDDDEVALRAMASVVRELGHPCRTASDAEEALAEYERCPAGIVLSDWGLPGMSGLELCQALKLRNPHVYVVLVTAHDKVSLLEGVHGGVDDFLRKPVDVDELVLRLAAAERLIRAVHVVEQVRNVLQSRPDRPQA
jgi:CheY-like chemotaxis protein